MIFKTGAGTERQSTVSAEQDCHLEAKRTMLAKKLQHLLGGLSQKLLRASVFVKLSDKRVEKVVVVENDYQRTELAAKKGDGQWILFRWEGIAFS